VQRKTDQVYWKGIVKMNSSIIDFLKEYLVFIVCGVAAFSIILLIMLIVSLVKIRKLNKKYSLFMNGKNAESLEDVILKRFSEIDELKFSDRVNKSDIKRIDENLMVTFQKVGMVKYDAFKEMGGKLSFSLALLNSRNDGLVLNSMHSREGCYTYIKEIVKGESFIVLSEEEKEALDQAIRSNDFNIKI